MSRPLPPEVDQIKNWCLKEERFEDANFIMDMKKTMKNEQKLNPIQASRLGRILSLYTLDIDLQKKIKERMNWWKK